MQPGYRGLQPRHAGLQPGHVGVQPGYIGLQPGYIGLQPRSRPRAGTPGWPEAVESASLGQGPGRRSSLSLSPTAARAGALLPGPREGSPEQAGGAAEAIGRSYRWPRGRPRAVAPLTMPVCRPGLGGLPLAQSAGYPPRSGRVSRRHGLGRPGRHGLGRHRHRDGVEIVRLLRGRREAAPEGWQG